MITVGYDINGNEVNPDASLCMAKSQTGNRTVYWIRLGTEGHHSGKILNRNGFNYSDGDEYRKNRTTGDRLYEFKPVKEDAFRLYLEFLKTGNGALATQTERALL